MKKRLFILLIIFSVITAAGLGVNYLLSLRKVTFTIDDATNSITIHHSDGRTVKSLTASGHILLQQGSYYATPEGENIAKDKIEFTVGDEDMTVDIKPAYSKESLDTMLSREKTAIESAIIAKYPSIFKDYTLSQGALYKRGEWFGGLLRPRVSDIRDQRDAYRVILHKENNTWTVIRRPEYILTSSRYKDVPIDVLREVNSVVGELEN